MNDPRVDGLLKDFALLKRQLENLRKPEVGIWLSWTPTITQSVSVTATITFARYMALDNLVIFRGRLAVTSAGTGNNPIIIGGIPASLAPVNAQNIFGGFRITDTGTADYVGLALWNSSSSFVGQVHSVAALTFMGQNPNFALASGDIIGFWGAYERA